MRRLLPSLLALALLAGCAGRQAVVPPTPAPATAPEPTAAPIAAPTEPPAAATAAPAASTGGTVDLGAARAGIQATLDTYAEAYNTGDRALLESAIDTSNAPFRRLVTERFENYQSSIFGGQGVFAYEVVEVEQRDLGFVQARVEQGGSAYDWLFREVGGRWLLSEPGERQLGKRIKFESENFVYEAYPWTEEINQTIAELMERARDQVGERLGELPEGKYTVRIRPIFGLTPPSPPGALAWYEAAARPRADRMQINAPGSYHFGGYSAADGWEADLYSTLVHEYTHLVNQRSFMPTASMRDWMFEGLAEYVSDSPRAGEVAEAVRSDRIIPIVDERGGVSPQDLDHIYILEQDRSLAYGLSYSLVAYIDQELGGLEKFWELARAMNETPGTGVARYDGAMQKVFGLSYAEFDAGWRAWLRESY